MEERKSILKNLASIDSIDAFRAIEKYNQSPLPELKEWTILSLQQSRMIIQSSLLDEQQVFISTGLGGKKDKLRYFLIFPYHHPIESLHEYQISALKNELEFNISKNDGTNVYFSLSIIISVLITIYFPVFLMNSGNISSIN